MQRMEALQSFNKIYGIYNKSTNAIRILVCRYKPLIEVFVQLETQTAVQFNSIISYTVEN